MTKIIRRLLDGYGSFFALSNPLSQALILFCALLQPASGFAGLLGGLCVLFWHRLLKFHNYNERIELVNSILLGMLIGSLYAFDAKTIALTALGGLLVVITSAIISATLTRFMALPLLGLPYVISAYIILPVGSVLQLPPANLSLGYFSLAFLSPFHCLEPLGALYFNGTAVGGILVFLAFLLSSRYLALLALASAVLCAFVLHLLSVYELSTLFLVAQMNGVLTATVIGGLYAMPGRRSLVVALTASVVSCLVSLSLASLMRVFSLPILALPFVLTTYACLITLGQQRAEPWTNFWLLAPALPEKSLEASTIAKVRGIDRRSVALKPPFEGKWQIYQGFGGEHTHQGNWHYALDFFQTRAGCSFRGIGHCVKDYFCFSAPVFSPAYGVVVACRDDVADNRPGEVDLVNNWGNYVIVRLETGSYLVLAHLEHNSLKVTVNSIVAPGQLLGQCGNSGRSPQPHLHMHVQEGIAFGSKTIPFHLTGVLSEARLPDSRTKHYQLNSTPQDKETLVAPRRNLALKRALRLAVGSRYIFEFLDQSDVGKTSELTVTLDGNGQFWLQSKQGAAVAFFSNEEILAFFSRNNVKDPVLDALTMAIGLTPFIEGMFTWEDAIPRKILPMSLKARILSSLFEPFQSCTRSKYERLWDATRRIWVQRGEHYVGNWFFTWKYISEAQLCEARGLVKVSIFGEGRLLYTADLMAHGLGADNGIPQTDFTLLKVV